MNETLVVAVISFFAAVVVFFTGLVGYFKVLKIEKDNKVDHDAIIKNASIIEINQQRIADFENRIELYKQQIETLKLSIDDLVRRVTECESGRKRLEAENQWLKEQLMKREE